MTLPELERAVARLGFSPSIEDGGALMRDAAVRALHEIGAARPRIRTATLWHLPPLPLYHESGVRETRGEKTVSLPEGSSYVVTLSGRGILTVSRGGKSEETAFDTAVGAPPVRIGGTFPEGVGGVTLRICGVGRYRILGIAVYDTPFEGTPPDEEGRVYSTQWSSVYDLSNPTLYMCVDQKYETVYTYAVIE